MPILYSIQYDNQPIEYQIHYSKRKTLAISVYPDHRVVVKAPTGLPQMTIADIVQHRAAWIQRKQQMFAAFPPKAQPLCYIDGESHAFLGQRYEIRLKHGMQDSVHQQATYLSIISRYPDEKNYVKKQLQKWYRQQAVIIFQQRLLHCYCHVQHLNIPFPSLSVRQMKRRWGSCSLKGKILLNTILVKTPLHCIDYVITHELCHFIEFNHSIAFYQLLSSVMPDWQQCKTELNQIGLLEE